MPYEWFRFGIELSKYNAQLEADAMKQARAGQSPRRKMGGR